MSTQFKYIFCIDDNEADLFYNRFLAEQAGITERFMEFTEIEETIRVLEEINQQSFEFLFPSLIILDLNMPMYNGIELLEKYHNLFLSLKEKGALSLILTTSQNPHDIKRARENKLVTELLPKPFKVSAIEKYLAYSPDEFRQRFLSA